LEWGGGGEEEKIIWGIGWYTSQVKPGSSGYDTGLEYAPLNCWAVRQSC
jgi:hypothetical protein